jgi:hypothetical protein
MDKLIAALASELIEPEENWNVLWIQNRRQYSERSGHSPPKAQWAFVALLCLPLLLAPHPAAAQFPGSWPTPAPTRRMSIREWTIPQTLANYRRLYGERQYSIAPNIPLAPLS